MSGTSARKRRHQPVWCLPKCRAWSMTRMGMKAMNTTTDRTQTPQTDFAAYLMLNGFQLLRIEGPAHRRQFVFDKEISPEIATRFYSSSEKRAIDTFRSLKSALMTQ